MNPAVLNIIRSELDKYVKENNRKSLILGVSGGIDSTLVAALARPICDSQKIPLIGRSLPSTTNKTGEIDRARLVGEAFCDDFIEVPIDTVWASLNILINANEPETAEDRKRNVRLGNRKARIRMIYLYDVAFANDGMVLSTDNLTEYLLGFWTLHGDVGDFGMIQNLWKTEVYELSRQLVLELNGKQAEALQLCIDAIPTDGLGITNSDLDQLGAATYPDVDSLLLGWLYNQDNQGHPVIQRHLKSAFKRDNPHNIPRKILLG